jgi:Protein of unknown function (DUF3168)
MPNSTWALQSAVHARLTSDAALLALLGGAFIYDRAPQAAAYPYVTYGQSTTRDWSTGSERGDEHVLTIHVWSHGDGRKSVEAIVDAIRAALHEVTLTLNGHRLINLRRDFAETRRENDGDIMHALIRFRAVTEPV